MLISLSAKNKLGFIDEACPAPTLTDPTFKLWSRCCCECSCEGKKKMIQFKGDERLIHFLMGLNDTYAPARSNILMLNPLPTVNHAYSLLMQDENQRENHLSSQFPGDNSSFMVGNQKPGNTYFKGNTSYKGRKATNYTIIIR
ncbi:hypothetical protein KY285_031329 [Solanum tuberosum]|nr:hypothetical protein KY284_031122 [Solanum tuberosum]KAH0656447.1 hypothetical protein KY285_031329 [Solanum tuberosum]